MNTSVTTQKNSNFSITLLHIIGMLMILACHYLQAEKIYFLSEIFISGVPLFLFVAGFLSGTSNIKSTSEWLLKKIRRVLVPFWLIIIIVYGIYDVFNLHDVTPFQWIFSILNLQGFNYTYWKFNYFGAVPGCGHLWYLTTLMFCYLLVPIIKKIKIPTLNSWKKVCIIIGLLLFQLLAMYTGFQLNYIISFFLGFFIAKNPIRTDIKWYGFISVLMFVTSVLRILLRFYIDNTDFYVRYYSVVSCSVIGIWVFYTIHFVNAKFPKLIQKLNCRPIRFIEKISYYVYLTHYLFLRGPFSVDFIENKILFYITVTVLSFVSATILYFITEKIIHKFLISRKNSNFI